MQPTGLPRTVLQAARQRHVRATQRDTAARSQRSLDADEQLDCAGPASHFDDDLASQGSCDVSIAFTDNFNANIDDDLRACTRAMQHPQGRHIHFEGLTEEEAAALREDLRPTCTTENAPAHVRLHQLKRQRTSDRSEDVHGHRPDGRPRHPKRRQHDTPNAASTC